MTDREVEDHIENEQSMSDNATSEFVDSSQPQCAYLLSEVSIFNNRVIWYLEQQQKQEIFALASTGALWAYLLKESTDSISYFVALVPPIIAAALYAKSLIMTKAMGESMDYLENLEESFKLENNLGWVHYYKSNTSNYKRKWRSYFWRGLLAANIIICCLFLYFSQPQKTDDNSIPVPGVSKEDVSEKASLTATPSNTNTKISDESQLVKEELK